MGNLRCGVKPVDFSETNRLWDKLRKIRDDNGLSRDMMKEICELTKDYDNTVEMLKKRIELAEGYVWLLKGN